MHLSLPRAITIASALAAASTLSLPAAAGEIVLPCPQKGWGHLPRWIPDTTGPGDNVGRAVANDGVTAVLGAPGGDAVHVYQRTGSTWSFLQTLVDPHGADNDFGAAVEVEGELMIVGAPGDPLNGPGSGVAHTYQRVAGAWVHTGVLEDETPTDFAEFGAAIGLSGVWAAVGAPGDSGLGSVSVFLRTFDDWALLWEPFFAGGGEFGSALSLKAVEGALEAHLFVGAWSDNGAGNNAGAVQGYRISPGTIHVGPVYRPPGLQAGDYFGADLAYDAGTLVVGAYGDDDAGTNAGAIYILDVDTSGGWPAMSVDLKTTGCHVGELDNFGRSVDISGKQIAAGAPNQEHAGDPGGKVHVFLKSPATFEWDEVNRVEPADGQLDDDFGWDVALAGNSLLVGARRVDEAASQGGAAYLVSLSSSEYPGGLLPSPHLATKTYYGEGKPGTWGEPDLFAFDVPVAGEYLTLHVMGGLPGSVPFLIWGLSPASIPFDGGTLLVGDPNVLVLPTLGVGGDSNLHWILPSGVGLLGLDVYMQAMFFDPLAAGPLHTAQTGGLQLTIGY